MLKRTDMPAWKALQAHAAHARPAPPAGPVPGRAARPASTSCSVDGARPAVRLLAPARHARDAWCCCSRSRARATSKRASRRCSRASRSTTPSSARRCTWRCAIARSARCWRRRHDVMPEVRAQSSRRCTTFVTGVHEGRITGSTGGALHGRRQHRHRRLRSRHRDGDRGAGALSQPGDPAALRVERRRRRTRRHAGADRSRHARCSSICSKTFTTLETLTQCDAPRASGWPASSAKRASHGISSPSRPTTPAMDRFGIAADARFTMWDWVGGRYSLWSTVGLSIALALGMDQFE